MSGPDVIALWGLGNAALLGILIGFGEWKLPVLLYAGSVAIIETTALVFWRIGSRRPDWAASTPALQRSRTSLLAGSAAVFIGAGAIWRPYMFIPVFYPAVLLLGELIGAVRRRMAT